MDEGHITCAHFCRGFHCDNLSINHFMGDNEF
jgi:hypothetical protein